VALVGNFTGPSSTTQAQCTRWKGRTTLQHGCITDVKASGNRSPLRKVAEADQSSYIMHIRNQRRNHESQLVPARTNYRVVSRHHLCRRYQLCKHRASGHSVEPVHQRQLRHCRAANGAFLNYTESFFGGCSKAEWAEWTTAL
jgi:hypothetical protein